MAPSFDQNPHWKALLDRLRNAASALESPDDWPAEQFQHLAESGVLGWVIPREFGGVEVAANGLLAGYVDLAAACLVTTFILTQRNGAAQRIAASENESLKRELLPPLARGEIFATVGISHLTTSRQYLGRPAVTVQSQGDDFVVTGEVPWVTGGPHADVIVTGGVCEDGRQVLLAIPGDAAGLTCESPVRLMALSASCTSRISLAGVRIPQRSLIAGPSERVMQASGGGTGSLGTSALAIGMAQRALDAMSAEREKRPELEPVVTVLDEEWRTLRTDLQAGADGGCGTEATCSPEAVRQRANSLVLRATQAALAASKGAGFVAGHPAERAVREAMFFLVWSCPQPVVAAALREFACLGD